jgi:hypothetical protein
VPLPGTKYPESLAFITSKNNPFKGLINWRWDTKLHLYISEAQFILSSLQNVQIQKHIHLSWGPRIVTRGGFDTFIQFFNWIFCEFWSPKIPQRQNCVIPIRSLNETGIWV